MRFTIRQSPIDPRLASWYSDLCGLAESGQQGLTARAGARQIPLARVQEIVDLIDAVRTGPPLLDMEVPRSGTPRVSGHLTSRTATRPAARRRARPQADAIRIATSPPVHPGGFWHGVYHLITGSS